MSPKKSNHDFILIIVILSPCIWNTVDGDNYSILDAIYYIIALCYSCIHLGLCWCHSAIVFPSFMAFGYESLMSNSCETDCEHLSCWIYIT